MSERNYTHNATWYDRDAREGVRVEGLSVRSPADWKPDFVEYELSINLEKFREWLSSKIASGGIDRNGWVNIDLAKSSPKPQQAKSAMPEFKEAPPAEDIPF